MKRRDLLVFGIFLFSVFSIVQATSLWKWQDTGGIILAWLNSTGSMEIKNSLRVNGTIIAYGYKLTQINLTPQQYNGNLVSGSLVGYDMADNICNSNFTGSHFCTQSEILNNIALDKAVGNNDGWISTGGPKYIPATVPVDDCYGFRYNGTTTHLGSYWKFNSTMGGYGACINCGTLINLTCCR